MSSDMRNLTVNCTVVRQSMSAYIDNEAGVTESSMVIEHVSVCPSCKVALANMYTIKEMVSSVYAPKVEVDFAANIMSRIEPKKFKQPRKQNKSLKYFYRYGTAAAVMFGAIWGTIFYVGQSSDMLVAEEKKFEKYALEHVNQQTDNYSAPSVMAVNFEK